MERTPVPALVAAPFLFADARRGVLANERGGYAPLLDLCEAWAGAAEAPKDFVLRRVIEWAVEGTFPPESFLTNTGDVVPPIKLLAAVRALHNPGHVITWPESASRIAPTVVGTLSLHIPPREALDVLADVWVSEEGVRRFCERVQIDPFSELPPACPRLAELEAADFAAETGERTEAVLSRSGAEGRCQAWLEGLMKGGQGPAKAKPAYREDAMGLFTGLSVRGFDRAWANAVTATGNEQWSKHGRKS